MTLQEFYTKVGGSYDEVLGRLRKDTLITKYLGFFGGDESYADLAKAINSQDWKQAFAASHSLKGLAANLGLEDLRQAASDICENLRNGTPSGEVQAQMNAVTTAYDNASAAIAELLQ